MTDRETGPGSGAVEEALRARFAEVHPEREAGAGTFAESVRAGRSAVRIREAGRGRRRRRAGWALALAAPAVIAVVALQLGQWTEERRALEAAREAAALAEWRAPSEQLLGDPYMVWMQGMPSLQASAVEFESQTTGGSQ